MKTLHLVEEVTKGNSPNLLNNSCVICVQHILGTTLAMFRSLFKIGLKAENVFILGKCYSTNKQVAHEMKKEKVEVSELSTYFDPTIPYDIQYKSYIEKFINDALNKILSSGIKKIILIDDGGQLIDTFNNLQINGIEIACVEQTSCGTTLLSKAKNLYSIVNVARSRAKKQYESKLIAKKIVENTFAQLNKLKVSPKKILIIGLGAIGRQIYELLNKNYSVDGFDIDKEKNLIRTNDFTSMLKDYNLIIGATGYTSLSLDQLNSLQKSTVVVSATSSDREFDVHKIRISMKEKLKNCHKNIFYNDIVILNNGFPINFDGSQHSVSPKLIQLTRALLVAGILQAVKAPLLSAGLIPLNEKDQNNIISDFKKILENKIDK